MLKYEDYRTRILLAIQTELHLKCHRKYFYQIISR